MQKFALLAVELPAAYRLDFINGAEKLGGSEVFEEKRTETLILAAVTPKINVPESARSITAAEFRNSPPYLTAPPTVFTPHRFRKRFLRRV
jgi:hypothetical protein